MVEDYVLSLLNVDLVAQVLALFVHLDHLLVVLPFDWPFLYDLLELPYLRLEDVHLLVSYPLEAL